MLVKQNMQNKLSSPFNVEPFTLVGKNGNSCTVESKEGSVYKRNSTHVKKYHEPETESHGDSGEPPDQTKTPDTVETNRRPVRNRKPPSYLKDYDLT